MKLSIVILLTVLFVSIECLDIEAEQNSEINPRTKRTVGVILKNVADVFGYDVIKRPALIIIKPLPQVLGPAPPPAPALPPAPGPSPAPAAPSVPASPPAPVPAPPAPAPPSAPAPPPPKPALQPPPVPPMPPAPQPPTAPPAPQPAILAPRQPPLPPAVQPPPFLTPSIRKAFNLNFSWMRGPAGSPPPAQNSPPPSPPPQNPPVVPSNPPTPPQTLQPPPPPPKPAAVPNPQSPNPSAVPNSPPPLPPPAPSVRPKQPPKAMVPPSPGKLNNYDDLELNEGERDNPTQHQQDYSGDYNDDRPQKYQLDFPEYENSEERSDYKRHIHPEPFQNHFDDKQKFKEQFDNFWQTSPWTIENGYRYLTKPIITEGRHASQNIPRGFSHEVSQESRPARFVSKVDYFPKGFSSFNVHNELPRHRQKRSINSPEINKPTKRDITTHLVYNLPKFIESVQLNQAAAQFDKELIYGPYRQVNEHILAYLNRNKDPVQSNSQVFDQEKIYGPYRQVNREILNFLNNQFANDAKRLNAITPPPQPLDPVGVKQKLVYPIIETQNGYTETNEDAIIRNPGIEKENEERYLSETENDHDAKTANENSKEQENIERYSKIDREVDTPKTFSKNKHDEKVIQNSDEYDEPEKENYGNTMNENGFEVRNEKTSNIFDSPKKVSITLSREISENNYDNEDLALEPEEKSNIWNVNYDKDEVPSGEEEYLHIKKNNDDEVTDREGDEQVTGKNDETDVAEQEEEESPNIYINEENNDQEANYEDGRKNISNSNNGKSDKMPNEDDENQHYNNDDDEKSNEEEKQDIEKEDDESSDELTHVEEENQNVGNYDEDQTREKSSERGAKYPTNELENEGNASEPLKSTQDENYANYIKNLQSIGFEDNLFIEKEKSNFEVQPRKVEYFNILNNKSDQRKNFEELKHVNLFNPYGHHREMLKKNNMKNNAIYNENKDALYTLVPAASVRELYRSDKPAAIPFDVEYSGSEEKRRTVKNSYVKKSMQQRRNDKNEYDQAAEIFVSDKFIPSKYDENFSYDFPEPQALDYTKLDKIELDEDEEKLSPNAKVHGDEYRKKKTTVILNKTVTSM